MNKNASDIYNLIQELAWYFGNHGFCGECCGEISLVEFITLKKADEDCNCCIQNIGKTLNFTKSGATKIVDRLENKGYVSRRYSQTDGRVCCVVLTDEGKDMISKITETYTSYIEGVLNDFKPENIEKIRDSLELLVKNIKTMRWSSMNEKEKIREHVQKNYAKIAVKGSEGCCSGGCSCNNDPIDINKSSIGIGYTTNDLSDAPSESNMGLGCGNPIASAALKKGETVLDLGSGGGFDCFLASKQVCETGYVIGVDMTPDMIRLARKNAENSGYTNVEFRLGEIEHLPVADSTIDVIISNCVINLSPEKDKVFNEAYRVLKPGGRLSLSDVVATAVLPEKARQDLALIASCIGGAEYKDNIRDMLHNAGFRNIEMTPKDNGREIVKEWAPGRNIEDFAASYIIKASKIQG